MTKHRNPNFIFSLHNREPKIYEFWDVIKFRIDFIYFTDQFYTEFIGIIWSVLKQ